MKRHHKKMMFPTDRDTASVKQAKKLGKLTFLVILLFSLVILALVAVALWKYLPNKQNTANVQARDAKADTFKLIEITNKYLVAKGDSQKQIADQIKPLAAKRKQEILKLIAQDPAAALAISVPDAIFDPIRSVAGGDLEKQFSHDNTLLNSFELVDVDGEKYTLKFAQQPLIAAGSKVNIQAYQWDNFLLVNSYTLSSGQQSAPLNIGSGQNTQLPNFSVQGYCKNPSTLTLKVTSLGQNSDKGSVVQVDKTSDFTSPVEGKIAAGSQSTEIVIPQSLAGSQNLYLKLGNQNNGVVSWSKVMIYRVISC